MHKSIVVKHMQAKSIKVYGKVQGVWYRASTCNKARELGLFGIVRNEADGTVYIEVEGPEAAVEELINWCRQGPPHAIVERLETTVILQKNYRSFEVHR